MEQTSDDAGEYAADSRSETVALEKRNSGRGLTRIRTNNQEMANTSVLIVMIRANPRLILS